MTRKSIGKKPYIRQRTTDMVGELCTVLTIFVVVETSQMVKEMIKGLVISLLSVTLIYAQGNESTTGKVIAVVDGNTLEVLAEDNETYKIMLFGIDCPETAQEYGDEAMKLTERLLLNKKITLTIMGKDRWGTRLAIVEVNGKDIRYELLTKGLAWTAERNPLAELEVVREKAEEEKRGLWGSNDPLAPWIFRRQQTMLTPKTS